MEKNYVAIYLQKTIMKKTVHIFQIAAVFAINGKYQYFHRFLKNPIKQTLKAVSEQEMVAYLSQIIQNKPLILKNDDDWDLIYLNRLYLKYLQKPLQNKIYDVAKNAKFLNLKKTNLNSLTAYYQCAFNNNNALPKSVYAAQQLYLVGTKMFALHEQTNPNQSV